MFRIECETTVKTIQYNNERKQCICHTVCISYQLYTVDTKFTERHINDKNEQKQHQKKLQKNADSTFFDWPQFGHRTVAPDDTTHS